MVQSDRWKQVTKNDPKYMNTFMKVVKHRMTTKSYYKHVSGGKSYSKTMALTLCREANLSTNKPLTIRDIGALEEVLDVKILVLSAKLGNKFCRVANDPERKNIYLYLTENPSGDGGHFDGIGSIHVFFFWLRLLLYQLPETLQKRETLLYKYLRRLWQSELQLDARSKTM